MLAVDGAGTGQPGQPAAGARVAPHASRARRHARSRHRSSWWACPAAAPPRSATCSRADPDNRSLLGGKRTSRSRRRPPRPTTTTRGSSPRARPPSAVDLINPGFKAIHHDEPDDAMECTRAPRAALPEPDLLDHVQRARATTSGCSPPTGDGAARYHRLVLQVLQSECPGRWQLKSPQYGLLLDSVFATYPDARMVVTHRDPVRIAASTFSLLRSLTGTFSDVDHTEYIVEPLARHALGARRPGDGLPRPRSGRTRSSTSPTPTSCATRSRVVGTIYERFGIEWNPDKEAYFRRFHVANPQHKYGTHTYSLAEVGRGAGAARRRGSRATGALRRAP